MVTVGTGGRVTIRAVTTAGGGLVPYRWEARSPWYDPRTRYANFVVLQNQPGFFNEWQPAAAARATFGAPAQTFRTGPYTVLVWKQNLLPALHEWAVRTGTAGTSVTSYRFGPPMPSARDRCPCCRGPRCRVLHRGLCNQICVR